MRWIRVQAVATCGACGETTPVNAAVDKAVCVRCGADNRLSAWPHTVSDLVEEAKTLDRNASVREAIDLGSAKLFVTVSASQGRCPDCGATWEDVPDGTCPSCHNAVSIRKAHGVQMVAEDAAALAGERGETVPDTMRCVGCGAPMPVDGTERRLTCGSCGGDNVVPDFLWRRVHDPTSVATWWWVVKGDPPEAGLGRAMGQVMALAAHGDVVYAICRYRDTFVLAALEGRSFVWMTPVDALGIEVTDLIAAGPSGLWVHAYNRRRVRCLSWEGVVKQDLRLPEAVLELVEDEDGSLVFRTAGGLKRWHDGKVVATWPHGCLRVFFGSPTDKRIGGATDGRIAHHPGGGMVAVARGEVSRIRRDGSVAWTHPVEQLWSGSVRPDVLPDGAVVAAPRFGVNSGARSSVLLVPPAGDPKLLRTADGGTEFCAVAATERGEIWASDGEVLWVMDREGQVAWRQRGRFG